MRCSTPEGITYTTFATHPAALTPLTAAVRNTDVLLLNRSGKRQGRLPMWSFVPTVSLNIPFLAIFRQLPHPDHLP